MLAKKTSCSDEGACCVVNYGSPCFASIVSVVCLDSIHSICSFDTPACRFPNYTNSSRCSVLFCFVFCRKMIQERASKTHLRRFVDVFRDNYFCETTGHAERNTIIRRIVEMLQHDGYSFLKPDGCALRTRMIGEEEEDDDGDDYRTTALGLWYRPRKSTRRSLICSGNPQSVIKVLPRLPVGQKGNSSSNKWRQGTTRSSLPGVSLLPCEAFRTWSRLRSCPRLSHRHCCCHRHSTSNNNSYCCSNHLFYHHHHKPFGSMSSTAAMHACRLLQQHLAATSTTSPKSTAKESCIPSVSTSALPKDGVIWSRGTRTIRLLEDTTADIGIVIPFTSYSLFPTAENDAFGRTAREEDTNKSSAIIPPLANTTSGETTANALTTAVSSYKTIGYTQ